MSLSWEPCRRQLWHFAINNNNPRNFKNSNIQKSALTMSSENNSSSHSSPVNTPVDPDSAKSLSGDAESVQETESVPANQSTETVLDPSNVQPAHSGSTQTLESSSAKLDPSGSLQPTSTNAPSSIKVTKAVDEKIEIILKATGDAPIMKKTKWNVVRSRTVGWVAMFIKKYSHLQETDSLFLYVNQSYAPAPDELLDNLYCCFGAENKLVLHYSRAQAWG
ncbi:Ubiquitin-like protein Atg12 [Trinorchestia longiramus]|nr:Ubiquitin-like protein Atg12 [Trinorchestia longiramus]